MTNQKEKKESTYRIVCDKCLKGGVDSHLEVTGNMMMIIEGNLVYGSQEYKSKNNNVYIYCKKHNLK